MSITPGTSQRRIGLSITEDTFGPGASISLNFRKGSFLATSNNSVVLTVESPTARIPYDILPVDLARLQMALSRGAIVMGPDPLYPEPRKGLMEPLFAKIDGAQSLSDIRETLFEVALGKKHFEGMPPAEVFRRVIVHESEGQCRDTFLNFIAGLIERVPGPQMVTEHPQDEKVVRVPLGTPYAPTPDPERDRVVSSLI